jgi:hypothetical protein
MQEVAFEKQQQDVRSQHQASREEMAKEYERAIEEMRKKHDARMESLAPLLETAVRTANLDKNEPTYCLRVLQICAAHTYAFTQDDKKYISRLVRSLPIQLYLQNVNHLLLGQQGFAHLSKLLRLDLLGCFLPTTADCSKKTLTEKHAALYSFWIKKLQTYAQLDPGESPHKAFALLLLLPLTTAHPDLGLCIVEIFRQFENKLSITEQVAIQSQLMSILESTQGTGLHEEFLAYRREQQQLVDLFKETTPQIQITPPPPMGVPPMQQQPNQLVPPPFYGHAYPAFRNGQPMFMQPGYHNGQAYGPGRYR